MLCLSTLNAAAKACTSKNHQWKEPSTLRRRRWVAEIKQPTTWLNQLSYFQWYDIYIHIYIYRLTLQNNRFNLSGTIPNMVEPCKTIFEINKQTTTTIPRCPQSLNWRHPATWHWSPQLPDAASGGSCFTEGNPYVAMCCFCNKWNKICFKSVSYFFYSQFLFVQRINPDGLVKFLLFLVKLPLVSSLNVTKYLECLHNFTWAIFMAEKLP